MASIAPATTPAATAAEVPLYHFNRLGRLGQNPGFVREIKQLFVGQVPEQLLELRAAIAAADWPQVAHLAHNLKAMFGNLGMEDAVSQLRQVESLAQQAADQRQQQLIVRAVETTATVVAQLFTQDLQQPT
ncbi:Hpt domain-containing protein [Hymenobacter canadensis]|uniref:Hpt domain-containing protein n=1 Tax=Hymenobacter canadensis TaxID=2999067 RepID=A0ABY7LRL9_9BACT|nr:Hpt domain-containing protein [Hymenobacter canadensis]WBA43067.1 Hpt domain-containing protein [Hymenobacter canadensis]